MKPFHNCFLFFLVFSVWILGTQSFVFGQGEAQKPKLDADARRARDISLAALDEMKAVLDEYYYDPTYHGIDLKARINTAKERVKTLQYNWQMYRVLAQVLLDLDDSHTFLLIPPRPDHYDYGFGVQMIGEDCFVTSVRDDGSAKQAGIDVGDQVLKIRNFTPSRPDLWKMIYVLYNLDPVSSLALQIRKPDGSERALTIKATTMTEREYREKQKKKKDKHKDVPFKCQEISDTTAVCKLFSFVVEPGTIDKMMKLAAKYQKLILDLRGNSGGRSDTEQHLISYFFDHEVKIADTPSRKKKEVERSSVLGSKQYKGEVAVLIDSESASAAEITARVLQIEKRGKIYGDISSGAVMGSYQIPFEKVMEKFGRIGIVRIGMSVTMQDVIMSDGSRIEKLGVVPDVVLQPTALGLFRKTDAVLAFVANKFGVELTPEKAGSFGFMVPDDDNDNGDADE